MPVEYFNPLRNVQIDPSINLEELARVAHSMGEVIGLGLRNLAHCPVELNLMPESTLKWQAFNQKKPYFIATVFSLVAVVAAMGFIFDQLAGVRNVELQKAMDEVKPQESRSELFKKESNNLKKAQKEVDQMVEWTNGRYYWADVLSELRNVLIRVETGSRNKFRADSGVWVERMVTAPEGGEGEAPVEGAPAVERPVGGGMSSDERERFMRRYGLRPGGAPAAPAPDATQPQPGDATAAVPKKKGNTNEIDSMDVTFKAVTLVSVSASANSELAFAVRNELRGDPMFDPEETDFCPGCTLTADEPPGVFTFRMTVKLKKPLKL